MIVYYNLQRFGESDQEYADRISVKCKKCGTDKKESIVRRRLFSMFPKAEVPSFSCDSSGYSYFYTVKLCDDCANRIANAFKEVADLYLGVNNNRDRGLSDGP
ncbi:hypothetical protein UFOVP733_16 [uncultured Caudovirales phage]|uniref:Uncharacterized protein n=1 Tax=uncultured Caudovirales phage TaxID=2100421 RepID=A0A6J5NU89_9CAUD|nr:hypothetical protein UFOVP733_16 [uncultured Caudovirales phage]CAB5224940.1 hypothetical protein UFOVP743_43 [uncultured Caudovirales phage]